MIDWKEYVAHQSMEGDGNKFLLFYLSSHVVPNTNVAVSIEKMSVDENDLDLTEDRMIEELKEVVKTFPKATATDELTKKRLAVEVAKNSRRGMANKEFGGALYYKGSNVFDSPLFVVSKGDRYMVIKHPNFEKYGFYLG
jgi:hypothetical protein